jgi:hypothetical protein
MNLQKALRNMGPIGLLTCVSALLAHAAQAVPNAPLGVVVSSQHAVLGSAYIADGSSLFDGDTISTQEKGSLGIRIGDASLAIGENSTLTLCRDRRAIRAVLISGKAQFLITAGSHVVIDALGATISARQDSASGVISVLSANEFQIGATHGSLNVDVYGDIRVVEEGKSYDGTFGAAADDQMPVATAKPRKILVWLIVLGVAAPTSISVYRATLSPSHPHK